MVIVRGEKQNLEPVQEMLGQTQGSSVQSTNVFADTFEFVYTDVADAYKMIGNAVPVNLAFAVATRIKHLLKGEIE